MRKYTTSEARANTYIERQPRRFRNLLASAVSLTKIMYCGCRDCSE